MAERKGKKARETQVNKESETDSTVTEAEVSITIIDSVTDPKEIIQDVTRSEQVSVETRGNSGDIHVELPSGSESGEASDSEQETNDKEQTGDDITLAKQLFAEENTRGNDELDSIRRSGRTTNKPAYKDMARGKHTPTQQDDKPSDKRPNKPSGDKSNKRELSLEAFEEKDSSIRTLIKKTDYLRLQVNEEKTLRVQAERKLSQEIDNVKKIRKEMNDTLHQLREEKEISANLSAINNDLQKQILVSSPNSTKRLLDTQHQLRKEKESVANLSEINTDQQKQITSLKSSKRQLETENKKAKEEIKKGKNQDKDEISQITQKESDARSTISKHEKTIKDLQSQTKSLENFNQELLATVTTHMKETKKKTQEKTKPKAILLGDSNGPNILPALRQEGTFEWSFPEKLYKAKDILNFVDNNKRDIDEAEVIAILCGTNHVRNRENAIDIQDLIADIITKLPSTKPKIIIEIPPFKTQRKFDADSQVVNYLLDQLAGKSTNTTIASYRNSKFNARDRNYIMHDELHLNKHTDATADIARAISSKSKEALNNKEKVEPETKRRRIEPKETPYKRQTTPRRSPPRRSRSSAQRNSRSPRPEKTISRTNSRTTIPREEYCNFEVTIPQEKIAAVIGKGKMRMTKWSETERVELQLTERINPENGARMSVKGKRSKVEKVIGEIKDTIENRRQELLERNNIPCRYENRGGCKRAECPYRHSKITIRRRGSRSPPRK